MNESYMGIEFLVDSEWQLGAAAAMSYQQAIDEAPKIAAVLGHTEYRVCRLTRDECLAFIQKAREAPAYRCPLCASILLPNGDDMRQLRCEVCGLKTTCEAVSAP